MWSLLVVQCAKQYREPELSPTRGAAMYRNNEEIKVQVEQRRDRIEHKTPMGPFLALAAVVVVILAVFVVIAR
ncbi:hypothetical protein GCM10010431_66020 [Streptomyces kunmingensis]